MVSLWRGILGGLIRRSARMSRKGGRGLSNRRTCRPMAIASRLSRALSRLGAVIALVLLTALVADAGPAAPAGSPVGQDATFSTLNVDIWPEHDDPRLLVIYRGQLSAGVPLPHTLTFSIPPGGQVNAAAYRTGDGRLLSTPYQYRQESDRLQVTFAVPEREFQFEYYLDAISPPPQRSFSLGLVFPLMAESLRIVVEQPMRSSGFTLVPPAGGTAVTNGGFTHHIYAPGMWPEGKPWNVRATYTKEDSNPSLLRVVQTPQAEAPPQPRPGAPRLRWLWGIVAAAALVLIGAAAFWYRRRARVSPGPRPAERVVQEPEPVGQRPGAPGRAYCGNCGARARPRDRFCSRCGRPLQVPGVRPPGRKG